MGSSGVDLENQQIAPPVDIDRRGRWITSLLERIHSLCYQLLIKPSSADDDSEELELTRTTHLAPASPHVSEAVSSLSVEDDSTITSTAPVSDQVILNIEDDTTTRKANEAKIQLANIEKIVKEKNFAALHEFRGIKGIAEATNPDLHHSEIPGDEQELLDQRSAVVSTTEAPTPSFFKLLLLSCFDWTVFLLLMCAFLSTVFGIQQEGPSNGWLEGAVGMFAISILVVVTTLQKYISVPHNRKTSQMEVKVCRGRNQLVDVSPSDVVPGDIVCLESGSLVPADGLFVSPGESLELEDGMELPTVDESNPFLDYGAKVVSGNGRMLVTCVGMKTTLGGLMGQVRCTPNQGQLPAQLDKLSTRLQNVGLSITILMTLVLMIRSRVLKDNEYPGLQADQLKGKTTASEELFNVIGRIFMKSSGQISVLATYVPLLIVGLSAGVPFSVALAITYWTKTTLSGKPIAQRISACFTMGSVSTICIGGGRLTLNPVLEVHVSHDGDQIIDTESVAGIEKHVREDLYKGISITLLMPSSPCSSTEHQLLLPWAKSNLGTDTEKLLKNCTIVVSKKLSTNDHEEACGVLIKDSETGGMWLYWNGPATTILPMCSEYYDSKGTTKLMDEQKKRDFKEIIGNMQSKHLKTFAFAYKKIDAPMPVEDNNLILIGLLGVKGCPETTMEAQKVLRKAGVDIKQFPKDNESVPSEGESPICYGKGRPLDKLHMVQRLKEEGKVVAMVGAKTNETPALKEANVGIAMGTCISEITGEGSDLIIRDGSLSSLVTIILIGRWIHYNIQKYIQVELNMIISLLVTNLVTTMFLGQCTLGAIQVVWANMLVTTLCGLAPLMEPPTEELMEKTLIKQTESLISKAMWRNILLQALYQASILVALEFKWKALPGINEKIMESIVFNCYVLCQVFSLVSSREPEKKNVFRGILRTPCLWAAVGFGITMQVAFVEVAHKVSGNARLDWTQWGICLLIAMVSWPIDLAGKCVWGVIMKIRTTISSHIDIGSPSMRSAAVSESASSRELL